MNTLENEEKSIGDQSPKENQVEKSYGSAGFKSSFKNSKFFAKSSKALLKKSKNDPPSAFDVAYLKLEDEF
jgi:hypothetical protein